MPLFSVFIASEGGHALFNIGAFAVNSYMTTMVAITIVIAVLGILAGRNIKTVPSGLQNVAEALLEMLDNFLTSLMGPKGARQYGPLLGTFFIFILFCNYSGLLPMSGHLPGLAAPTSTLSVTAGLAIIVFFCTHAFGIKEHGIHYFGHFLKPVAFMLPLMLIEELVRPLSLSLRLYGNIFGEETVTAQIFGLVPLGVPIVMQALSVLMGLVQAGVFMILAAVYISGATGESH